MPIGAGAALAAKLHGTDRVALAFFGDGGANQGVVHETMNLAAAWKLPSIFICENNKYALSTDTQAHHAGEIAEARRGLRHAGRARGRQRRARGLQAVKEAVARRGRATGPTFIEAATYRWGGHSMRVNSRTTATEEEEEEWIERDPDRALRPRGRGQEGPLADAAQGARAGRRAGLDEAVRFAVASAEPTARSMESSVYAPHAAWTEPRPGDAPVAL